MPLAKASLQYFFSDGFTIIKISKMRIKKHYYITIFSRNINNTGTHQKDEIQINQLKHV